MISVRYFCEILMSTAAWLCHNVFTILFLKCSMTRELKNTWRLRLNNTGRQWVGESKEKISYIAQQGSHTAVRWSTNQRAGSPFELFLPWAPWADSPQTHTRLLHSVRATSRPVPRLQKARVILFFQRSNLTSDLFPNRSHTMITATTKNIDAIQDFFFFFRLADTVCWHNH